MSKSGIELLEELCEKVELLSRRFDVIEHNTKQILNRLEIKTEQKQIIAIAKEGPKITQVVQPLKEEVLKPGTSRVMSKLKKDNRMLSGVSVKIVNENNEVVRETKTNRAGEWQCFLSTGQYKAEYLLENVINSSVVFNVTPDQQLLRVPYPGV